MSRLNKGGSYEFPSLAQGRLAAVPEEAGFTPAG